MADHLGRAAARLRELVDVERSAGGLLRVYIDRIPGRAYPTGDHEFVTVEDCEAVTRQLQYVLEVENVDYARLEVSSPGLDRPLKRPEHYARFAGQQVEITLKLPFQGRKRFQGVLHAAEGEGDAASWQLIFNDGKVDQVLNDYQPYVAPRYVQAAAKAGGQQVAAAK